MSSSFVAGSLLAVLSVLGCWHVQPSSPPGEARSSGVSVAQLASPPGHSLLCAQQPVALHFGRIVDVYGLKNHGPKQSIVLYRTAVLIPPDAAIASSADAGEEPLSYLPCNPDTLRQRILIRQPIASDSFQQALAALEQAVRPFAAGQVLPRNAALRLAFANERDAAIVRQMPGGIELLVAGEANPRPIGVIAQGASLLIDTALFGSAVLGSAVTRAVPANKLVSAAGYLPKATACLRVGGGTSPQCWNFELGDLLADAEPLRIIGEMSLRLDRIAKMKDGTCVVSLFLNGIRHSLDQGDVLLVYAANAEGDDAKRAPVVLEVTEDVATPSGGLPRRVHARVHVAAGQAGEQLLEQLDPSRRRDYPASGGEQREAWMIRHAPKVVLKSVYEPHKGDDASNFIRMQTAAIVDTDRNRIDVAPNAGFRVGFSKPVDLGTVDTMANMMLRTADRTGVVPVRLFVDDDSGLNFRLMPPLGLPLMQPMRDAILADRELPIAKRRPNFVVEIVAGDRAARSAGMRSVGGAELAAGLRFPFVLDPIAADNIVSW